MWAQWVTALPKSSDVFPYYKINKIFLSSAPSFLWPSPLQLQGLLGSFDLLVPVPLNYFSKISSLLCQFLLIFAHIPPSQGRLFYQHLHKIAFSPSLPYSSLWYYLNLSYLFLCFCFPHGTYSQLLYHKLNYLFSVCLFHQNLRCMTVGTLFCTLLSLQCPHSVGIIKAQWTFSWVSCWNLLKQW